MMNKKIVYNVLVFVISIGLFSSCSYSDNQLSQKHSKSIMIKSNAVINVKPDTAILNLYIDTVGKNGETNKDIQSKNNNTISSIIDNILKSDILDRQDIYISDYGYGSDTDVNGIKSNAIYTSISMKVRDINKIEEIITKANNEATKFGIDITTNIEFTVSNYDKYYKEVLNKAIEEGNIKAKALSKSLGIDLGSVVKIDENQEYTDDNENNNFKNINYEEKSNSFIGVNKLIKASVNMTFEY